MIRLLMVRENPHVILQSVQLKTKRELLILFLFVVKGRAFAVTPFEILDLGDDLEGEYAGKAIADFERNFVGWEEMKAKMCAIMQI